MIVTTLWHILNMLIIILAIGVAVSLLIGYVILVGSVIKQVENYWDTQQRCWDMQKDCWNTTEDESE